MVLFDINQNPARDRLGRFFPKLFRIQQFFILRIRDISGFHQGCGHERSAQHGKVGLANSLVQYIEPLNQLPLDVCAQLLAFTQVFVLGHVLEDQVYLVQPLGVDLVDCYLLHPTRDFSTKGSVRSDGIYVFPIGPVPSDGRKIDLAYRCYPPEEEEKLSQVLQRSTLTKAQSEWGAAFRSVLSKVGYGSESRTRVALGQERNALLLASTLGEYDATQVAGLRTSFFGLAAWSRDRLRQLDLREQLRPGSVILIGFADDPGPVRLFRRVADRPYRMLKPDPDHSWTMYRIRIPVTLHEAPPVDEADDELDELIRRRQGGT